MEQRRAGIVGDEVKLDFLASALHHHVFYHACRRHSRNAVQLEIVTMESFRRPTSKLCTGMSEMFEKARRPYS